LRLNELKAEIVRNDLTVEEFADVVNIPRTTIWRRFKNPNSFTLSEIRAIISTLKLDGKKINDIFFADLVS